jgi:hypothetical protein
MNVRRFRRHVEGLLQQMQENANYLRERVENLDERVRERSLDEVTNRIQWNYAEQSVKEPVDERARMLEHAAAGVVDVRLTLPNTRRSSESCSSSIRTTCLR